MNDTHNLAIGIDLGGTKIEAAVLRRDTLEVVDRTRIATPGQEGSTQRAEERYDDILSACSELIRKVAKANSVDLSRVGIGVGMPGGTSRATGFVKNSNTTSLNGRPFREDLQRRLARPICFENDANCFALAEARIGAARELRDGLVFGVIMGTGVGGGFVFKFGSESRLWAGPQGLAGEWGHHSVYAVPEGSALLRPCYCGRSGCLEKYISGPAVEKHYEELSGRRASLSEIASMSEAGDSHAVRAMELFLETFARGIGTVINVIDPSIIVLGGGVSNLRDLYDDGAKRLRHHVFNDEVTTPIVKNKLGDSAGVLGAALLTF